MVLFEQYIDGQFCWVDLISQGIAEIKPFYEQLMGWSSNDQEAPPEMPYTVFEFEGRPVAGVGQMSPEMQQSGMPAMWNSYINVADIEATAARAAQLGGTVAMPPMEIPNAGKMAMIADPTGAHVALWQKGQHYGAAYVNDAPGWCWNELATDQPEAAAEFYRQWLGWEVVLNEDGDDYWSLNVGDRSQAGMLKRTPEMGNVPNHWSVYFSVDSIQQATECVAKLGGQVFVPQMTVSVGTLSVVSDPQGAVFNLIELSVPVDPAPTPPPA